MTPDSRKHLVLVEMEFDRPVSARQARNEAFNLLNPGYLGTGSAKHIVRLLSHYLAKRDKEQAAARDDSALHRKLMNTISDLTGIARNLGAMK